jgi:hypothetical protein
MLSHIVLIQENQKKAQVEDNWICTSAHFEDVLKFKDETLVFLYALL